jgi:hypothetical protein
VSPRTCRLLGFAIALVAMLFPAAAGAATTFNVTTDSDSSAGTCLPGSCTLRQAVAAVNGGTGGDSINVPAGLYTLIFGELQLQKNVTIHGAGPAATLIDGDAMSRIFNVAAAGVTASIGGLAVENGRVAGTGVAQAHGGGILNSGTLTLDDVLVRGNIVLPADNTGALPAGGGIFNSGALRVSNSAIEGNHATTLPLGGGIPEGAGISNEGGQVEMTDSVLSNNVTTAEAIPAGGGMSSSAPTAHGASVTLTRVLVDGNKAIDNSAGGVPEGGGIYVSRTDLTIRDSAVTDNDATGGAIADSAGVYVQREGNFTLERSLVADNVAESGVFTNGAGVDVVGATSEVQKIVNSTITGNRGTSPSGNSGAGILHSGARLDVLSSTISGNIASGSGAADHGGNLSDGGAGGSVLSVRDSIVSSGGAASGSENCSGTGVQSAGHNIDSLDQCNFHAPGDKVSTNPLLGALADNGGLTETLALGPSSPAIDAGDAGCPATDQRGVTRPQGAVCDIGAFELKIPPNAGGGPVGPAPAVVHPACVVPRLKGHKLTADRKRLKKAGCRLGKVKGHRSKSARVKKQSLKPGSVLPPGSKVNVKLTG